MWFLYQSQRPNILRAARMGTTAPKRVGSSNDPDTLHGQRRAYNLSRIAKFARRSRHNIAIISRDDQGSLVISVAREPQPTMERTNTLLKVLERDLTL